MIEIACLIVVGVITWLVSTEGIWGAAQTFLCTLIAGLLAMNFFEPLTFMLTFLPDNYRDLVALLGLFTGFTFGLRLGAEQLSPSYVQVIPMVDTAGRYVFGAASGYLTMAILLTSLHTAPLPREFMGFKAERNNFFGFAPDRQWLGFVQYISEKPFARQIGSQIIGNSGQKVPIMHAFDGKFEVVGDPQKPYNNFVWPSFPIRYAMRRERIDSGLSATAPPSAPATATPVIPPQTGGTMPAF